MTVHQGRHEMPGWRGYLPDSIDRASRGPGRRAGHFRRRAVAVGALAACVVAGGAAATQTRSVWRADPSPGPVDTSGSVLADSSAWLREAGPVLSAVEFELRRVDGVRQQWETSAMARRAGPAPSAVVALLERRSALERHRETLRAATVAVRAEPASAPLLSSAQEQLRAAQQMLRDLGAGRGVLGDRTEAAVLELVGDRRSLAASGDARPFVQAVRTSASSSPARLVAAIDTDATRPAAGAAGEASSVASVEAPRGPSGPAPEPAPEPGLAASPSPSLTPEPDPPATRELEVDRVSPDPPATEAAPATESSVPSETSEPSETPEPTVTPAVENSMLTFGGAPPEDGLTREAITVDEPADGDDTDLFDT